MSIVQDLLKHKLITLNQCQHITLSSSFRIDTQMNELQTFMHYFDEIAAALKIEAVNTI